MFLNVNSSFGTGYNLIINIQLTKRDPLMDSLATQWATRLKLRGKNCHLMSRGAERNRMFLTITATSQGGSNSEEIKEIRILLSLKAETACRLHACNPKQVSLIARASDINADKVLTDLLTITHKPKEPSIKSQPIVVELESKLKAPSHKIFRPPEWRTPEENTSSPLPTHMGEAMASECSLWIRLAFDIIELVDLSFSL